MSKAPVIELTPNGKTLVAVYPSPTQGLLISRFLNIMGEPEMLCTGEPEAPDTIMILFPHQNMPEELKEAAETMTTQNLLNSLGYDLKP